MNAGTVPDPTTDSLEAGLAVVREPGADSAIGFGSGSPMDTAKALGLQGVQAGRMRDYQAPHTILGPALPVIAVPTGQRLGGTLPTVCRTRCSSPP
ncbi:iron-containing alcohol dehydrogenase [Streptomyces sp. NPDC001536]|uniref:iron-containing alcohol dehydrogenase n=1 Tax=Streptomyces sp. NPDC001536 TaxID=3364583 RepID=UPI0036B2119E